MSFSQRVGVQDSQWLHLLTVTISSLAVERHNSTLNRTFFSNLTKSDCLIKLSNVYVVIVRSVGCTVIEMLTTMPPLLDPESEELDYNQKTYKIANLKVEPPKSCSSLAFGFLVRCLR